MSNEKKSQPRRPDYEADYVRIALWDNRHEGGQLKFQMSGALKSIEERVQDARDNAREGERDDKRSETNRSGREDRRDRNDAPRYER